MKTEYHEGPEAQKKFETGMSKLLRVPKGAVKDKTLPKLKESVRKTRKPDGKG